METLTFSLSDIASLYLATVAAYLFRFGVKWPDENWHATFVVLPFVAIGLILIVHLFEMHHRIQSRSGSEIITSIIFCNLLMGIFYLAISYWLRDFNVPRSVLVYTCFFCACLQYGFREIARYVWKKKILPGYTLVIGGSMQEAMKIAQHVQAQYPKKSWGSKRKIVITVPPYPDLDRTLYEADAVIIGADVNKAQRSHMMTLRLTTQRPVRCIPDGDDLLSLAPLGDPLGDMLSLLYLPFEVSKIYQLFKRVFDIVISIALLMIFSIPMVLLLALIPMSSPGSPLYVQTRVGKDGRIFRIYKFRSMVQNAEKRSGAVLATVDDSRITKFGRLLRGTRLDEIPQLFNVLIGDMSLIGPRPERPEFVEGYEREIPYYRLRHVVRPGITGLAQVEGDYATSAGEKLRYDLWYIRHYSPILDLKVLFQTAVVVLHTRRAKGINSLAEKDSKIIQTLSQP